MWRIESPAVVVVGRVGDGFLEEVENGLEEGGALVVAGET